MNFEEDEACMDDEACMEEEEDNYDMEGPIIDNVIEDQEDQVPKLFFIRLPPEFLLASGPTER